MRHHISMPHIGLRTVKTTAAIVISLMLVYFYGTTSSKYIFAMLGAMAAMEPTFKESLEACLTQIVGLLFGVLTGVLLLLLPIHPVLQCGIGILMTITLYNVLRIRFSPSLPCMMVVILCTTPDVQPFSLALGRFWDTALGLVIGMAINSLVFPYDNSRHIRAAVEALDQQTLSFLENYFDGDMELPDPQQADATVEKLTQQLRIFSNQKLWMHLHRQHDQLAQFRLCETRAKELIAQIKVLYHMGKPAKLNDENRQKLSSIGVEIRDQRKLGKPSQRDIVANYHVAQILRLRKDLADILQS